MTDGFTSPVDAKTAVSLLRYRTADIAGVIDREHAGQDAWKLFGLGQGIPVIAEPTDVADADSIYLGIAPPGGKLPASWRPTVLAAIQSGIDVVSGLHDFLVEDEEFVRLAKLSGSKLVDVRRNRFKSTASGHAFRPGCIRVHSVGHDCSIGKMITTIEVARELASRGHASQFLATGQTGIMVSGIGIPVDCIVADFVNGAVEQLVANHEHNDFLLIEGQGSIAHPAYSAVTAGLLHGCAPQSLIFCYEAGRTHIKGLDPMPIVPIDQQIAALEAMANLRHPCKVIGISVNTRTLTADQAVREIEQAEDRFGLPATDVYRFGANKLADACEEVRSKL